MERSMKLLMVSIETHESKLYGVRRSMVKHSGYCKQV